MLFCDLADSTRLAGQLDPEDLRDVVLAYQAAGVSVTPLTLTRLTRQQVEALVLRVTDGKPMPTEVLAQIVAKADGIPLFVEELVKTIREAGPVQEAADRYVLSGSLPPVAIPAPCRTP